ncbi:MAG: ATP-binding protein [Adhaeribacter sp.]|nr:ATP-binding protein [Adhaeribacter sp.]
MNNSIRIKSNKSNLKVVRDFVTNYLSPFTLSEKELNQIILAVDEITANLIIHANKEDEGKFVKLAIFHTGDTFLFELSDNGHSFKPEKYREPNIADIIREGGKGGMGIALVKRIMDKVEFTTHDSGNICRLYKKVNQLV